MTPYVLGFAAVAIAPQIGYHHRVIPGQLHRHLRPGEMRLGCTVQQQNGWATAAYQGVNDGAAGLDLAGAETGEQSGVEIAVGLGKQ